MSEQEAKSLLVYRFKFVALVAVFLLPFIAGWLAFYVFDYRPVSENYGALVQPVRPMVMPPLSDLEGRPLAAGFWNKWSFVVLVKEDCDELCRNNLYYLRQMRVALGRDMDRVQNVLMLGHNVSDDLAQFLQQYPGLSVVEQADRTLFSAFDLPDIRPGEAPVLYLMDPAGNLMMTYSAVNDPASILSDLRRLLKLSQIG